MAHYRIERTLPNGYRMRLDMISWDGTFLTTPTTLGEVVLTDVGTLTAEFDTLPYGLMSPMEFKFNLVWDMLPPAMQTYLEQGAGVYGGFEARNTWYLYTDRGTGGTTWTCEFIGVEDNIEALELEPLPNGMYGYNVEAVDIAYFYLKTNTGSKFLNAIGPTYSPAQRTCWQVFFDGSQNVNRYRKQEFEFWSTGSEGYFTFVSDLLNLFRSTATDFIALSHATSSGFDSTSAIRTIMKHAITYHRPSSITTVPRNGTSIDGDVVFVLAYILNTSSRATIGGLLSASDEYGFANPTLSLYDLLRSICEQSAVRVGYRFTVTGTGSGTAVNVVFDVKGITQSRDYAITSTTPDQTLDIDTSLSYSNITVRGDNILKAESRYKTSSEKDATQIVKIQKGARASRSFNFEPVLINVPVDVQDNNPDKTWPYFKAPLKQSNLLFYNPAVFGGGGPYTFVKLHEKTIVKWGAGAGESVTVDPTGYKTPTNAYDYPTNGNTQVDYALQLNDAQVNGGITAAITSTMLVVFANEKNAILECEWSISNNTKVMTDYICGRYTLTGAVASKFPMLNWSRAIVVSMEVDLLKDTVKHKYMLVK